MKQLPLLLLALLFLPVLPQGAIAQILYCSQVDQGEFVFLEYLTKEQAERIRKERTVYLCSDDNENKQREYVKR
jgi:hypothetical protein